MDKNFVFINEVWYSVSSRTKRGRPLIGTSPHISVIAIRSTKISVIAAMYKYGMVNYKINDKPVNGEDCKEFILNL